MGQIIARRQLSSVEVYDPCAGTWSDCAPMLTARRGRGLCAAGGSLFVIGGYDLNSVELASAERYDVSEDRWTEMQPMHIGRR